MCNHEPAVPLSSAAHRKSFSSLFLIYGPQLYSYASLCLLQRSFSQHQAAVVSEEALISFVHQLLVQQQRLANKVRQ